MELRLESRTVDGWTVLAVAGEVDVYTAPKLRERLVELISSGSHRLVVDLEGVDFLDSTGLGSLVAGLKRVKEQNGVMALAGARDPVRKVLSITGLDKVFPLHDSVEGATKAP